MGYIKKVSMFPGGKTVMPPSKSITHRAIICTALAGGGEVKQALFSEDTSATARCAEALRGDGDKVFDCGESGSTLRFMIPVASIKPGKKVFTGSEKLMKRPLRPYIEELGRHGLDITQGENSLTVTGSLKCGVYKLPGDLSSQFVSGLLLALPLLDGDSEIRLTTALQSASYVDITLGVMSKFGVTAYNDFYDRFLIHGRQKYVPCNMEIEGDYSQAAFFMVAGALGYECECLGLEPYSRQGDSVIVDIIKSSGAKVRRYKSGGVSVSPGEKIRQMAVDAAHIPDLVPPIAALLAFAEGKSKIYNVGRLRYKESNRLLTVCSELKKLGAKVSLGGDYMDIIGSERISGGVATSHNDHRIAMMAAVAAIRCAGPVFIKDADCVAKSYPGFWDDFEKRNKELGM
jgi:3-phosphoshikimate 1-carboxyvinyltransferase